MTWVAGVDGCRGGWVALLVDTQKARLHRPEIRVCTGFGEVLALSENLTVLAVDIPIGLLEKPQRGGRLCDQEARRLLGRRASSVFSPPSRRVLQAENYSQVRRQGLTCQAFGILPKIREVDRLMTPGLQAKVYEAHPELTFRALTGHPMRFNKKTAKGRRERLEVLKNGPVIWLEEFARRLAVTSNDFPRRQVAPDDLIDAAALAYTALCIARKEAFCLPLHPPLDRKGLRMEIRY